MISSAYRAIKLFAFCALCSVTSIGVTSADVIDVDTTRLTPDVAAACREAEAIWEARIQAYSEEIPNALRMQLTSLRIRCEIIDIGDGGVGEILAQAGPDSIITITTNDFTGTEQTFGAALETTLSFDVDDIPFLIADDTLVQVAVHEMGHCLGIGPLWATNGYLDQVGGGFGLTQYVNGRYTLPTYRVESRNPVAQFVPLEQGGGGGTSLAHWADVEPVFNRVEASNQQDVMVGFLGVFDPDTGAILFPDFIISETTFASCADLGFAVEGINGHLAASPGAGTGRWPKTTGQGTDPFDGNGVPTDPDAELNFLRVKMRSVMKLVNDERDAGSEEGVKGTAGSDPYNLRNQRWTAGGNK